MSKVKKKVMIYFSLLPICILASVFLSTFAHLSLNKEFTGIEQLGFVECTTSMAENQKHVMLFLVVLFVLAGLLCLPFMSKKTSDFESLVTQITPTIATPVAIGQGQHGTARWLRKDEYSTVFATFNIDPKDKIISELLLHGYDETINNNSKSTVKEGSEDEQEKNNS